MCIRDRIYEAIRESGIISHKTRQKFLSEMVEGIIKGRSVIFSEITDKINKPVKEESIERRIQDFFLEVPVKKYKKLFGIVSLAYTICWAMGIQDGKSAVL